MVIYLLICLISVLAGRGALRLMRLHVQPRASLYLAPAVTLTFWAVFLGLGVSFGVPVKHLWVPGWGATLVLAVAGAWREDRQFLVGEWSSLALVTILPVAVLAPYFWHGITTYPGSPMLDGWSYIAYGQYLWEYPRGAEGGLAPLYQYAAHLSRARFIASALLGFFSPLVASGGDTQAASGYVLAWGLFALSSACTFFGLVKGLERPWLLLYVSLSVFSGWMANLWWANNYDNLLALTYLPAVAGVAALATPHDFRWGMVVGGLAAGISYCYPEMAPVVLGGACLFLLQRMAAAGKALGRWLLLLLGAAALAALLVAPFARDAVIFLRGQARGALSGQGGRPGEGLFSTLLATKDLLPAYWGLKPGKLRPLAALGLSVLAALGVVELFRRKEWALLLTLGLLVLGSLFAIFYLAYDYGAYKLILAEWWALAFAVIAGAQLLLARARPGRQRLGLQIAVGGLFLGFLYANAFRVVALDKLIPEKSINRFKQAQQIQGIVGHEGVLVAVDDVWANAWAVYFLRDLPIRLVAYRGYMAQRHVVPLMDRAKAIAMSDLHYILTDNGASLSLPASGPLLWSGGPYRLWKLPLDSARSRTGLRNEPPATQQRTAGRPRQ